jgi:hypothetical protein
MGAGSGGKRKRFARMTQMHRACFKKGDAMLKVERDFEYTRLQEELMACAYELLAPIVRRLIASKRKDRSEAGSGRLSGLEKRDAAGG